MNKIKLDNIEEIVAREFRINPFLSAQKLTNFLTKNYGKGCSAIFVELDVDDVIPGDENTQSPNDKIQEKWNKADKIDPILVSTSLEVIDGHHRLRAAIFQGREKIDAYQIVPSDE